MSEVATKKDVMDAVAELGAELRAELATKKDVAKLGADLRAEMADIGAGLRTEMVVMKTQLIVAMREAVAEAAKGLDEGWRSYFSAVDDKYKDLPAEHAKLRQEFNEHASDVRVHVRPVAAPPKRARRPRAR